MIKGKYAATAILASLAFAMTVFAAKADEIIEVIEFDGELINVIQTDDAEQVIAIGERELGRNYFAGFDRVTEVGGIPVALFYLGDGGNACGPSTLIIWREEENSIQSLNYQEGCSTPAPAINDNGIYFVPYLNPGESRPLKRWSPSLGIATMGNISFAPESGTLWSDLATNPASHPLDFFMNEAVYNQAANLLGDDLKHYATGLRVASEPKTLQSGMIMASGCIPHNCGGGDSLIIANPKDQTVFMAQQNGTDYNYWPSLDSWPAPAIEALDIFRKER